MPEEYKSNSHRTKEEADRKKVEKVIKGEATLKKKSSTQKLAETFISEDVENVKSYVIFDVLIPALKDTLYDMITTGFGMLLGGESRGGSYRRTSTNSRDSYDRYYDKRNRRTKSSSRSTSIRDRRTVDDVILDTRGEAEEVRDVLEGIIDEYGMASVLDLKEAVGMKSVPSDSNYGWYDLNASSIARTRDGYLLKLPRVTLLD